MNQLMTSARKNLTRQCQPHFIAIVGGSGSGKTWLAGQLQKIFGKESARLSLDDFYRDRSHLKASARTRINFDHPRAIDWPAFEKALRALAQGRAAQIPQYDFKTHCRKDEAVILKPRPVIIIDGLWLLRSRALRRYFDTAIFLDCPEKLRLQRRLARDCVERGRDKALVKRQFTEAVAPMHERFVAPQKSRAKITFSKPPTVHDVRRLAKELQAYE